MIVHIPQKHNTLTHTYTYLFFQHNPNMKLLRSTFIAFCLTPGTVAFTTTTNAPSKKQYVAVSAKFTTQLQMIGLDSPMGGGIPDDDAILKEKQFREVLNEISVAKDYLDYITEESIKAKFGTGTLVEEKGGEQTFSEVLADKAAAAGSGGDDIELFGGGGDDATSTSTDIKETRYQPNLRSDLGSTVLLSGTADATLLNVLNNNFFGQDNIANFQFSKIKALVDDVALAKKSAISREARYSGLLDKLSIEPSSGALPTAAELDGASSWIAQISSNDASTLLPQVAELAMNSNELKHVIVLVTDVNSNTVDGWEALETASGNGENFQCTLVAVGEMFFGGKEGGLYHVGKMADTTVSNALSSGGMSSKEVYQLLGHALALESTAGQALTACSYSQAAIEAVASPYAEGEFTTRDDDGNEITDEMKEVKMYGRMIQGLREIGFTRTSELDVLVKKGLEVR